ncbi:MAG: TatD family hydrolase [Enterococcus sp.]|nr:TatD family hydrolase [Enterococcus sp.]
MANTDVSCLSVGVDLEPIDNSYPYQAVGLHPWWISKYSNEEIRKILGKLMDNIGMFKHFGEFGLDFSDKFKATKTKQFKFFTMFIELIAWSDLVKKGFKSCVSLHSYMGEDLVLDVLETFDACKRMNIILHSFSGNQHELEQAINLGCFFSYSVSQLESSKRSDYIKKIPFSQLMLESDLPRQEHLALDVDTYKTTLEASANKIYELRKDKDGFSFDEFRSRLAQNSLRHLNGE